jgi:hypothetical protein
MKTTTDKPTTPLLPFPYLRFGCRLCEPTRADKPTAAAQMGP